MTSSFNVSGIVLRICPAETDKFPATVKQLFTIYANDIFELFTPPSVSLAERLSQKKLDEADNLPGEYAAGRGCILLAEYDDEVAGCITMSEITSVLCELKRVYVKPQLRRMGIAKKLADAVSKLLRVKTRRITNED